MTTAQSVVNVENTVMDGGIELSGTTVSETLGAALALPGGARFYRCALQINPFGYLQWFGKATKFTSEIECNAAIINACILSNLQFPHKFSVFVKF